jgi:alcohol dehydrogenase class IV
MKQKAHIGKNAIVEWLSDVKKVAPKHCFVVRGHRSFEACGGRAIIERLQKETQCEITEFEDFSVNPKIEEAKVGLEMFKQSQADLIVAIGGGSVLDMAKLIRHMAVEQGYAAALHAIPTTAGTGAEATHFAVVYIDGKKQSIAADDVLPDVAVVYPPLTYSNGTYQTACAGFDAVAQAIESYWAKGATEESRVYSVKALGFLWKQLPQLVQAPTEELRDQVAEGAYWAGRAINISTTTAPHAFSYAFTSHYGYPHGHAVALTFPFFVQLNGTKTLFKILGLSPTNIIRQIEDYITSLGLDLHLKPFVDIKMTLQEVNIQRLSNNPVEVTPEIITELEKLLNTHK